MALLFCKSSFYRTAILSWLFVSLAGLMLGALLIISATAATPPPQGRVSTSSMKAAMQDITKGENSQLTLPPGINKGSSPSSPSGKRDRALMKANFEKVKRDTQELSDLAKALQQELSKSNDNILSLDIVDKAGKIEKLAKRIKGTARGY